MSGRVLVVDDAATNRISLKAQLTAACYTVAQAASGVEALAAARREAPDVVVMGVRMPGMDGIAACARLKTDPATRAVPVILIASAADQALRLRALGAGADDLLHRPVDETALKARLRNLLREKAMDDELALRAQTCRALGLAEEAAPPPLPEAPIRIEVVCAAPRACHAVRRALAPLLKARIDCLSPRRALAARNAGDGPEVVIVLPDGGTGRDVLAVLPDLRSRSATRNSAILALLDGGPDGALAAAALDLGANDYAAVDTDPE